MRALFEVANCCVLSLRSSRKANGSKLSAGCAGAALPLSCFEAVDNSVAADCGGAICGGFCYIEGAADTFVMNWGGGGLKPGGAPGLTMPGGGPLGLGPGYIPGGGPSALMPGGGPEPIPGGGPIIPPPLPKPAGGGPPILTGGGPILLPGGP